MDYLEATPIKHEEKVQRVTQDVEFRELTTEWHVRYTISPRWVSEQVKFLQLYESLALITNLGQGC